MKKERTLSLIATFIVFVVFFEAKAQHLGLKTNLLYWATTTPNCGIELKVSDHYTWSASIGYNAFNFPNSNSSQGLRRNPKIHHWLMAAENKYWFCQAFERHYMGLSLIGGKYNAGGITFIPFMKNHRYEGWTCGTGLNYGYQWTLSSRWGIDASIGLGYMFMKYNQYQSKRCGDLEKRSTFHYVGITKLSVSFTYYID